MSELKQRAIISSALQVHVQDFQCVAPKCVEGDFTVVVAQDHYKFRAFWSFLKNVEKWVERLSEFYEFDLGSNLFMNTFGVSQPSRLQNYSLGVKN